MRQSAFFLLAGVLLATYAMAEGHRVLVVANDKLAILAPDGKTEWEMPWKGGSHDLHMLPNGHILAIRDAHVVVEVDPKTKQDVWTYNAAESNGNHGKPIEVHAIQPLPRDKFMIAEGGASRIIEIDRTGKLLKTIPLKVSSPSPHRDTRLARKIANGHYLVCHEGDGVIREYDATGKVVWDFPVPLFGQQPKDGHGPEAFGNQAFSAIRLKSGNTLIGAGNGHALLEVTPDRKIVWELHQKDLPNITLAWVTTQELLPNGHLVFGNCHAGPGQPEIIEIDRNKKKVLWKFDHYDTLGNDLTNSVVLDLAGKTNR